MKTTHKFSLPLAMLAMPIAAYAESAPSIGEIYSLVGGFAGGFAGALVACWLCKRMGAKKGGDSNR